MNVLILKSCQRGNKTYLVGKDYLVNAAIGNDMQRQGFAKICEPIRSKRNQIDEMLKEGGEQEQMKLDNENEQMKLDNENEFDPDSLDGEDLDLPR